MKKLILLLIVPLLLTSCKPAIYQSDIFAMNTYITQQIYGIHASKSAELVRGYIANYESVLSMHVTGSDIDNINKNAGIAPVKVLNTTFELLNIAKQYSELCDGAFDVTIAPITELWGITEDNPVVPTKDKISQAVALVDYKKIILDESAKTVMLKDKGMSIDLGGIAKGFVCNEIEKIYDENDITGAVVSIGGNIFSYGTRPDGKRFILGIRDPNGSAYEYFGKLKVENAVVATSGGYERYFEQDGKRYHHILDTKTGYPVESDLVSVTVVSQNGGLADFLSTAIFIQGSQKIDYYLAQDDFSVIIVDNQGNVHISDSLAEDFMLTNKSYKLV